jgi:hypothetical protein
VQPNIIAHLQDPSVAGLFGSQELAHQLPVETVAAVAMPRKKPPLPAPKDLIESDASLKDLSDLVQQCRGCDLWERATQAVLGEGAAGAEVMFVGEQPGNREDLEGRPFVGPAGKLLDEALSRAGIERKRVYITNVVKHFNPTRAANSEFTRSRTRKKSPPAAHGLRLRSNASGRR